MKSAHKHELRTNELADAISRLIQNVKPHGRAIGYAALAVVALIVILVVIPAMRGRGATHNDATDAFNSAQASRDTQPLRDFLKDFPAAPEVPAARLLLANRDLAEAASGIGLAQGEDRKARMATRLAEAREMYQQAASVKDIEPLARVGLALVTIQEGDLDKGKASLQEVVQKWPQSVAADQARAHVAALSGYKPMSFSNEPIEEPAKPEAKSAAATGSTATAAPSPATGSPAPAPKG